MLVHPCSAPSSLRRPALAHVMQSSLPRPQSWLCKCMCACRACAHAGRFKTNRLSWIVLITLANILQVPMFLQPVGF